MAVKLSKLKPPPDPSRFASNYAHHAAVSWDVMGPALPAVAKAVRAHKPDTLVGCGLGSIPWVVALSRCMRLPYVLVRKPGEVCRACETRPLVGYWGPAKLCVFVDDRVCAGGTRRHVYTTLRKAGATPLATVEIRNIEDPRADSSRLFGPRSPIDIARDFCNGC